MFKSISPGNTYYHEHTLDTCEKIHQTLYVDAGVHIISSTYNRHNGLFYETAEHFVKAQDAPRWHPLKALPAILSDEA